MKNKSKLLFAIFMLLISSCGKRNTINIPYTEQGGFHTINKSEFNNLFNSKENNIFLFTLSSGNYCDTCYGGTLADLNQYAYDNNFVINEYIFDVDNKDFINDYKEIDKEMRKNNDLGFEEITYLEDKPIISDLPSLFVVSKGYIALKVKRDFVKTLRETVKVEKNS